MDIPPALDEASLITTSNVTPVIGINKTVPVPSTATDQVGSLSKPPTPLQLPAIITGMKGLNNEAAIGRNTTDTICNDQLPPHHPLVTSQQLPALSCQKVSL